MIDVDFAGRLLRWHAIHGRHNLPWQVNPSPYRVWISEIMLQQTQVSTVIPFFLRFMQRFPDVHSLATADIDQVLHLWTGLGYYARARNLHQAAKTICDEFNGEFPGSVEQLTTLSGIGQSTAGAIAALSLGVRAPILDGNVKRVLTRFHALDGYPEKSDIKQQLWKIADAFTPVENFGAYTQAIMDLGATVCTRTKPLCQACPVHLDCKAYLTNTTGSYPGKKPKKSLPIKTVTMFVLKNQHAEVLLERRPPNGIWGSLYSLPEYDTEDALDVKSIQAMALPSIGRIQLNEIRHSFSHFHLHITPVLVNVVHDKSGIADSNHWLWYPLDHSVEVGLAAPVKKLLNSL